MRSEKLLKAALNALRSYQHGNSSPDLARSIADVIEQYLDKPAPETIDRARVVELAKNAGFPGFAAFIEKGFDVVPSGPDNADG